MLVAAPAVCLVAIHTAVWEMTGTEGAWEAERPKGFDVEIAWYRVALMLGSLSNGRTVGARGRNRSERYLVL